MIKVKFFEAQEVEDGEGIVIESFRAGQVVELTNASARFWISRGLASDVQGAARNTRLGALTAGMKKFEVGKAEDGAEPETAAKVNPTLTKSGKAKRSYVRRRDRV